MELLLLEEPEDGELEHQRVAPGRVVPTGPLFTICIPSTIYHFDISMQHRGPPAGTGTPVTSRGVGVTLRAVTLRPGPLGGVRTSPTGGQMEYRLARNAVVREFRKGRLSRLDVCDAHPELQRAARHVGSASGEVCPICEEINLVEVTFVFGARLPAGGRCAATPAELAKLCRRKDPVVCYVIEVCPGCAWNHLVRMYPGGAGVTPARPALRSGSGGRTV